MRKSNLYPYSNRINFVFNPRNIELTDEELKIIQRHWKQETESNKNFFNGTALTLSNLQISERNLFFEFCKTTYAHYLASDKNLLSPGSQTHSFYVSAIIKTKDDYIAFGKMGEFSFEPGRFQFIGGGLEEKYIHGRRIDFQQCMKDELREELGLDLSDAPYAKEFKPFFLSIGKIRKKISLVFYLSLDMESNQLSDLLQRYNKKRADNKKSIEVDKMIFVNKDNYQDFFKNNSDAVFDENLFSSIDGYYAGINENDSIEKIKFQNSFLSLL